MHLTETWLHANVSDTLISNPRYNSTRLDRQTVLPSGTVKKGGGICIYTKSELSLEVLGDDSISDSQLELLHVVLRFTHQKDIHIIAAYRPPTSNAVVAVNRIRDVLSEIGDSKEIVLTGDFNINMLNKSAQATKTLSKTGWEQIPTAANRRSN